MGARKRRPRSDGTSPDSAAAQSGNLQGEVHNPIYLVDPSFSSPCSECSRLLGGPVRKRILVQGPATCLTLIATSVKHLLTETSQSLEKSQMLCLSVCTGSTRLPD